MSALKACENKYAQLGLTGCTAAVSSSSCFLHWEQGKHTPEDGDLVGAVHDFFL